MSALATLGALIAQAPALPLACTRDLLIDLPLFMGPVVVLVGWLLMATRKARKQDSRSATVPQGRLSL